MRRETEVRTPARSSLELPAQSGQAAAPAAAGILRRLPAPVKEMQREGNVPETKRRQDPEFERAWQEGVRRKTETTPALDVNHLAERVIQAIDRRIVAQRERLGRA